MELLGVYLALSGVSILGLAVYVIYEGGILLGSLFAFVGLWLLSDGISYLKNRK